MPKWKPITLQEQLQAQVQELEKDLKNYHQAELGSQPLSALDRDPLRLEELMLFSGSEPLRSLLQNRAHLLAKQAALRRQTQDFFHEVDSVTLFDQGKKFIDLTDDSWNAVRAQVSGGFTDVIGPFLSGIPGCIIHAYEGVQGIRRSVKAYRDETIPQRKTRIATGLFSFMCAGAGLGLGASFLANSFGAAVSGTTVGLAPVLMPGLLVAIYGANLFWRSYAFARAKEDEELADSDYETSLAESQVKFKKLRDEIASLEKKRKIFLEQLGNKKSSRDLSTNPRYRKIQRELHEKHLEFAQTEGELEGKQQRQLHFRKERLAAESEVAFSSVEVAFATLTTIAIILGSAALLGAVSVASFGTVPFALLLVGIVGAGLVKIFEYQNEKQDYAYTTRIRNWFINTWKRLKGESTDPVMKKGPELDPDSSRPANLIDRLSKSSSNLANKEPSQSKLESFDVNLHQDQSASFLDRPKGHALVKNNAKAWCCVDNDVDTQYRLVQSGQVKSEKYKAQGLKELESALVKNDSRLPTAQPDKIKILPKIQAGDTILCSHRLAGENKANAKIALVQECVNPGKELHSQLLAPTDRFSSRQLLQSVDFQFQESNRHFALKNGEAPTVTVFSLKLDSHMRASAPLKKLERACLEYCLALKINCQVIQAGQRVTLSAKQLQSLIPEVKSEAVLAQIGSFRRLSAAEMTRVEGKAEKQQSELSITLTDSPPAKP